MQVMMPWIILYIIMNEEGLQLLNVECDVYTQSLLITKYNMLIFQAMKTRISK